ncbi:MAG: manganese efflux pump MntP family protein [Halarsenatibacteraceae bacterium]
MIKLSIIVLGIALSLDAFGVALGLGCGTKLSLKEESSLIFSFGFFQFFFALTGALIGNFINSNIIQITATFSGFIILILGIYLINEGRQIEEECIYYNLSLVKYIALGIGVSIDALGVGFSTLYAQEINALILNSIIIGLITTTLTFFSFKTVTYIKNFKIVEKYSDYIGGVILVLFGLTMIF